MKIHLDSQRKKNQIIFTVFVIVSYISFSEKEDTQGDNNHEFEYFTKYPVDESLITA